MKTLEFKLTVNQSQATKINQWLDDLRWVWNRGLSLLEESQQRRWQEKLNTPLPPGLILKYRNGKLTGTGIRKSREGYKCCPIRQNQNIEDTKKLFNSGSYYNNTNAPYLLEIPTKYRTGVHKSLQEAWKNYQNPQHQARRPRYKGKRDVFRSLANYNAGGKSQDLKPVGIVGTNNGYVQFPGLGKLHVKGLFKRFNPTEPYGVAKIVLEPSGYYLQVAIESEEKPLKLSDKAVGIDPGVAACITDDLGRQVKPANLLKKQLKKLRRLQRKAARQKKGSNSQKRTYQQIARLHERVRRARSAFNHKLSTKLVSEYGAIAFEGSNLQNMTRRPKAQLREDGKGYKHNKAKAKAGLNRALSDVAWGDLRAKTEQKCKAKGREFVATKAQNSSITCSACGHADKTNRVTQKDFLCVACGHTDNADANASKNHLLNSGFLETGKYRPWGWKLMRSTKDVTSHPADTLSKEEKRSCNGMPSEGATLSLSSEVPPSGELTAPTSNPLDFPAYQQVYGKSNQPDNPQTLAHNELEPNQAIEEVAAKAETLFKTQTQSLGIKTKGKRKSKKRTSKLTSAQLNTETFIQMELWESAAEIDFQSG